MGPMKASPEAQDQMQAHSKEAVGEPRRCTRGAGSHNWEWWGECDEGQSLA